VDIFENIFDTVVVQVIVSESNRHAQQEISKASGPIMFLSGITKWDIVIVYKVYVVLAVFMLMGIVQKTTLRSYCLKKQQR
jgi:hypothetical protein